MQRVRFEAVAKAYNCIHITVKYFNYAKFNSGSYRVKLARLIALWYNTLSGYALSCALLGVEKGSGVTPLPVPDSLNGTNLEYIQF